MCTEPTVRGETSFLTFGLIVQQVVNNAQEGTR